MIQRGQKGEQRRIMLRPEHSKRRSMVSPRRSYHPVLRWMTADPTPFFVIAYSLFAGQQFKWLHF
ncbi:MAG: hypothetical protein P4L67_02415 [Candidatus Pacebacteria bacterium]|nr:hypothetical protein [Candidatus Paceibacterota bacterium]